MALTYEEALETICSMFEGWDRETITAVFESNGYHVERTIEAILSMEQPTGGESDVPSSGDNRSGNLLDFEDDFEQSSVQAVNPVDSNIGRPAESTSGKRGIPCTLPADFLVRPGQSNQQFLRDEQLALMLQNELFQREVQQALGGGHPFGDDYFRDRNAQGTSNRGDRQRASSQPAAEDPLAIPDMGILKALQGMGDGMKNQLNQLALKFNSTGGGSHAKDDSDIGDMESRPLTAAADYEEEDDDEDRPLVSSASSSSGGTTRRRGKKDN